MKNIIFSILLVISTTALYAQWANQNSNFDGKIDTSYATGIGGEVKGLYIGSGALIITSTAMILSVRDLYDESPLHDYIVISGGLIAPGGIIGMGLGALLAENHSQINRSFQLGTGIVLAPIHLRSTYNTTESYYRLGLNFRIISPEISKWRYSFGISHFFFDEYKLYDASTLKSASEIDLDLQYLFFLGKSIKIYPFIGSQLLIKNIHKTSGFSRQYRKSTYGTNLGLGACFEFKNRMNLIVEMKISADFDHTRYIFSIGTSYYLR